MGAMYTNAELDRAIALRAQGLRWREIAESLQRPENSLKSQVCRYQKGIRTKGVREKSARLNDRLAELAEKGVPPVVMARQEGLTYHSCYMRLRNLGFDAQLIAEYRSAA